MNSSKKYCVRAAFCHHRTSDEVIYDTICKIVEPLEKSLDKIKNARKIVIKANMAWPPEQLQYFEGRRKEHVDDSVLRAVLRFLRGYTSAEIVATDVDANCIADLGGINYMPVLNEFGVEFVDSNQPPFKIYDVPGGGLMFSRYKLSECFADADAVVSLAKLKNHAFMGVTMCLKNLFGLTPMLPHYRPRQYFHHVIRLSYALPDLGLITKPCLNIIDALVGQARREWSGEGRICNTLIAGDHVVATDACGTWLMGYNPATDWPQMPFKRDRNALLVAAENGFGTVDMDEIDFQTDINPPLGEFKTDEPDSPETVISWRKTTCEQGLYYLDHQDELMDQYAGEYIYLQDDEVVLNGPDISNMGSRRGLSRGRPDHALWLKLVDPEDMEGEKFEVYKDNLERLT
jgi:uncharacterized protein (DUF362 family)